MPVERNLAQNRRPGIGKHGHDSVLAPIENRANQSETLLEDLFQNPGGRGFEAAGGPNRAVVRATLREFVFPNLVDYIHKIDLTAARHFLVYIFDRFNRQEVVIISE